MSLRRNMPGGHHPELPLSRILYVDDEPHIQTVVKMSLELVGGFEVATCGSADEALAQLSPFRPQLVVLDVMMPVVDGPTTLEKIRGRFGFERMPAIFMTAKVQPEELRALRMHGVLGIIGKPFDPMTLADEIRRLWHAGHPA
ncbi:response regulator [Chitinimonas sp. BJYL2]|uniref:response regulator n=1 Tax=Chitinimonas sp. BJYL2 TaxID=2976696 RepID=UPI0022B55445|nr:response regulator [Chitinimonas sp. BJYL2]